MTLKRKLKVNEAKLAIEAACMRNNKDEVNKLVSDYFDVNDVRRIFHYKNNQTIRNLVFQKKLTPIKVFGKLLFKKSEIEEILNNRQG